MKTTSILLGLLIGGAGLAAGSAGDPGASTLVPASSSGRADDEQAIRAVTAAFVKAYNAGDVQAIAALYTEDAENVDEDGNVVQGRSAIADQFARILAADPGGTIFSETNVITFVNKDRALWKSVDRTEGGRVVPDIGEFILLRQPPRPRQQATSPPTPATR